MTDKATPRTDAEKEYLAFETNKDGIFIKLVRKDFAKEIEAELSLANLMISYARERLAVAERDAAETKQRLKEAMKLMLWLRNHYDVGSREQLIRAEVLRRIDVALKKDEQT